MSLHRKIMIYIGITTLGLLTLLYVISKSMLLDNYERLELSSVRENMKQSLLAFFDEYTNLGAITINYAGWDDTYNFVARPAIPAENDPYLTDNYTDSLFVSSRLNATLLFNNEKRLYFGKAYDYAEKRALPHPGTLVEALLKEHPSFLEHPVESSRKQGLLIVDNKPMIAASYPVLTSNNEGPVHGTLVFVRYLDSNYIKYISEKTDMPFSISIVEPSFSPPPDAVMIGGPGNRSLPFWTVSDKTTVRSFCLLTDIDSKPALLLEYSKPRALVKEANNGIMFYLLYFALSGFVFFFIVSFVLQRTLFARLNRTISGMNAIEEKQDFSIRIPESGKDEITKLEKSFNHMMSSLEHAQSEIHYQAYHDPLTGLSNRKAFYAQLEKTIMHSSRDRVRFALLFVDLDRFKFINDTMGHHAGDLLLVEVAERLRQCLSDEDFVCRLAGDEFCIITRSVRDSSQIEQLAQAIQRAFEAPFDLHGHRASVSASIGISLYPEHGTDSESLLHHSDVAMLEVKETGKNHYRWYADSMEAIRARRLRMEQFLQSAIVRNELTVHYQPKRDLAQGKTVGVEALLRWNSPQLGNVPPYEFIPVAESSGIIHDIGEWVIRSVCRQFAAWQNEFADMSLIVAINISGVQLLQPNFARRIRTIFAEEGADPRHFELEVTESFMIAKFDEVVDIFAQLRDFGFLISIDDFGAGYSSMKYLFQLPIQCMKIDKTLIDHLADNARNQVIVSALIDMAHQLQLTVVAEGVELPEQLRILESYRCDQIQGYLIGKPVPAEELRALLRSVSAPGISS
ncbi:EAL domain-containing protein [Gordoniibacillus kamchatkensis]|uniref:EAL domain-containing protein n=1 Tax=Gordoniibacillus kamchatkensis TaxID=1590651 RepID=UPI0006961905|nr:EAL domain-containing protein [Paenibacillus sp. VKM B-2647]